MTGEKNKSQGLFLSVIIILAAIVGFANYLIQRDTWSLWAFICLLVLAVIFGIGYMVTLRNRNS